MAMSNGVVVQKAQVTYADTTAKEIFQLPNKAVVLGFWVQVTEAFTDTGTDYLDIGTPSDGDYYVNDYDVSSLGGGQATTLQNPTVSGLSSVTATYVGQNSNADAGKATVIIMYASPFLPH